MLEETHHLRVTARIKLSAGLKPETIVENLIRQGYLREEAAEAVTLELALRDSPAAESKTFILPRRRKSLLRRLLLPLLILVIILAALFLLSPFRASFDIAK